MKVTGIHRALLLVAALTCTHSAAPQTTHKEAKPQGTSHKSCKVVRDVVYGRSHPDGAPPVDLVMDVYTPAKPADAPRPALLMLHGNPGDSPYPGGRQHGFREQARYFAQQGYGVFVVAYPFFGAIQVKTAVRHIRANAATYGLAPDRIACLGHSLGSNLAMRSAVTDEDHEMPNSAEKADPLNNWGVSGKTNAAILVGGGAAPRPYEEFDAQDPPICFVHGTADTSAPFEQALMRRGICQRTNVRYAFLRIEGMGHSVPLSREEVAFGRTTFGEFVDAFLRVFMLGETDGAFVSLSLGLRGKGEVVVEPEHALYPRGQGVTLRAQPAPGFTFSGWKGDVPHASTSQVSLTLDRAKRAEAVFVRTR
jgi:acetyl esterase/lipase